MSLTGSKITSIEILKRDIEKFKEKKWGLVVIDEAQATDRTYRIGQVKNVIVHRLITIGTFEEKIDEMIQAKKELADLTVTMGEQWLTELSNKDLKEIFSLGKLC